MKATLMHGILASAVAMVLCALDTPVAQAQTVCYQDEDGRIVTRRRPGYQEVPCPDVEPAPDADTPEGETDVRPEVGV